MPDFPYKRGTILIPSGPTNDEGRNNLFVVCSDPCAQQLVAIVPISSYTNDHCDQTCILNNGEHSFIVKKSYVLYRKSQTISCADISKGISSGLFKKHDDMNGQTFLRIRNGICRSNQTPRKIKKYMNCEE